MSGIFKVVIIGAGEINFGSPEGPWNHSARLEQIFKNSATQLHFIALVDPDISRAAQRIRDKRACSDPDVRSAWQLTKAFNCIAEAAALLIANGDDEVHLVILGCPPHFRGALQPGKRADLEMLEHFPKAKSYLVEKPVSAINPFLSNDCDEVASRFAAAPGYTSVGYMLRYNKAILKIREILHQNGLTPTCINARYYMAYEYARKLDWWNKSHSCGPVVEQATHFIDLIRFLAGDNNDAMLGSVRATTVTHTEPVGALSQLGFDETLIPSEERVPRVTNAFWKHQKGTIGSLTHGITLHEIEVLADGWILRVRNAYDAITTLAIRSPHKAEEQIIRLEDDAFLTEFQCLVRSSLSNADNTLALDNVPQEPLSSFADALKTYKLSWQIRLAAEQDVLHSS
uniref:Uncharacterized protein n=1 Tax=Melanopsichium pennsylvanicum 4 TaxID=1398559 RepID=A0A077RA42_9BASI|nr:uncharacterized protein BN887_02644 [Melanopsichium pennsylvanicum 4]